MTDRDPPTPGGEDAEASATTTTDRMPEISPDILDRTVDDSAAGPIGVTMAQPIAHPPLPFGGSEPAGARKLRPTQISSDRKRPALPFQSQHGEPVDLRRAPKMAGRPFGVLQFGLRARRCRE